MSPSDNHLVELLLIPGIGRAKARILYSAGFRSLQELDECPFEELSSIPGIGKSLAYTIKDYAEMMEDVGDDETSGDKLETSTGLSMCPMCGSLLGEDADSCPKCGIAFEDDDTDTEPEIEAQSEPIDPDAPDGYWYKEEKSQFFLCPDCGAMISEDATKCGNCGVAFDPNIDEPELELDPEPKVDKETQELADMLVDKAEEDLDGHWYKDEAQLFLCPGCGAFISVDAKECDTCGIGFDDDDEDQIPEIEAEVELISQDIPDSIEHEEEETQFFLCTECGAFISEDSPKCDKCGTIFETEGVEEEKVEVEIPLLDQDEPATIDVEVPDNEEEVDTDDLLDMLIREDTPDTEEITEDTDQQTPKDIILSEEDEKVVLELDEEITPAEELEALEVATLETIDISDDILEMDEEGLENALEMEIKEAPEDIIVPKQEDEQDPIEEVEDPIELKELADMLVTADATIDDATDEAGNDKEDASAGTGKNDLDGHWYKDEAQLFLCPECGALISEDAEKCPSCGITFDPSEYEMDQPEMDEETKELADMLVERPDSDLDGHWYKDEAQLYLCPSCGAFISTGAHECEVCGAEFDDSEEELEPTPEITPIDPDAPDGHWYKEDKSSFFLCTECGALISEDATSCANCGIAFDPSAEVEEPITDDETKKLADMLVEKSDSDLDGHWYKDEAQLYLCPNCGAFISAGTHECEVCGAKLDPDEEEELLSTPEMEPAGLDAPDEHMPEEDEMTQIFLCTECGALISEEATSCANCGAIYDEEVHSETEPELDDEKRLRAEREIDELSNLLVETTSEKEAEEQLDMHEEWEDTVSELHLCPGCGAFVLSDIESCPDCGISLGIAELAADVEGIELGDLELDIHEIPVEAIPVIAETIDDIPVELDLKEELVADSEIQLTDEITPDEDAGSDIQDILSGIIAEDHEEDVFVEDEIEDFGILVDELMAETVPETSKDDRIEIDGFELFLTEDDEVEEEKDELDNLELDSVQPRFDDDDDDDDDDEDILSLNIDEIDDGEPDDLSDIDLLKGLEPDLAEMDILKKLEDAIEIPEPDAVKEERKGISKDFLSRWARLGDEPEGEIEEVTAPSLSSKEFFTQLMVDDGEDDGGLPDVVDIGMEINEVIVLENVDMLDQQIEDDPENDELYARKARLLAKAGSFEDAIANYDKAAELNVDREEEYKKRILEILQGTDPSDPDDELDDLELDTVKQETDAAKARLIEIDEDLALFPGTKSLLQEKGELLDGLGMHEAALECYDQIIQSSYKEIEATGQQKPRDDVSDSLQMDLVREQGRVNGRTNGIGRGRVDGRINGLTNGKTRGMTNGRTNGATIGKVNGRINGAAIGKVNGRINGLTNGQGLVNGRINGTAIEKVNGRINGLTNGKVNGLTNGKVNGLLAQLGSGGLINGMGLINGDGLASSHGRLRRQRAKFRDSSAWRVRITLMAFLIFIMMFIPVLTNMMISDETYGMSIDGNFGDWIEFQEYHDSPVDQIINDDINIISTKVNFKPPNLYLYLQVEGEILGGESNDDVLGMDSIFIFIDSDADPSTGYSISDLGADILLDVRGWSNSINRLEVSRFEEGRDQNDWNGFSFSHTGVGALVHGELELRVALNELNGFSQPNMIIALQDSFGRLDISDSTITPLHGTLRASVMEGVKNDILDVGGQDAGLIRLEAFGRRAEASAMSFDLAGELEVEDMENLRLVMDTDDDGVFAPSIDTDIPTVLAPNGREFTLTFNDPLVIEAGEELNIFLVFDVAEDTLAQNVGVKLSDIEVSEGTVVHIAINAGAIHNIGTPSRISIDGAFGDWENVGQNIDSANDVMSGNMDFNTSLINRNVDISDYRMMVDDRLLVYTSVAGVAMGGVDIPVIRYRHIVSDNDAIITPPPPPDSDNDGVPDALDGLDGSMAHDFNNDGVPDADSGGDRDGDGNQDYTNGGTDYWLETTIPDDYDENYSGMEISRYIGPVQHQEKKGLDYLSVYIDSDNDQKTGAYINGRLGADYMALIAGRNNVIVSSEVFRYEPANLIPWEKMSNISSALDYHRMELGLPLSLLGISALDEFSISLEMSDWKHFQDISDEPLGHIALATGTRALAGDNIVLNEMATLPNGAEWIEVANPTDAPIDLSGWYIQVQLFGWRTIYTFPGGTTAGAWGSGTEYVVADDPFGGPWWFFGDQLRNNLNVRLRDSSGTIADATTIGTVGAGQTWSRFKNETYGMPTDTDDDANDWYVSNDGWIMPEGPTPGAPNDRRRPVILVEKVGNLSVTAPNTQVRFTINYNNIGDGLARNVWINDTLPAGMTYVSSSVPYTSITGSTYTWLFTNIAPGTTNSFTITVLIGAGVPLGTTLTNLAELEYTDQLNWPMEYSSDTWDVLVSGPIPMVTIEKIASSAEVSPSGWLSYTIWYNNTGTANAGNVWINDTLPADISFDSASPSPNSTLGQTQYWHFVNVPPGTHSITVYGNVSGSAVIGSILTNTVTCNYTDLSGSPMASSSDSASVTVVDPSFQILINEIRVRNNNAEWLEVVNPTNVPVDISGWIIWRGGIIYTFPAGTILGAFGSGTEFYVADVGGGNDFPNAGSTVYLAANIGGWMVIDQTTYPGGITAAQTWSRFKHEDTGIPVDTDNDANDFYISNNAWLVPEGPTPGGHNDRKRPIMVVEKTADLSLAEPGDIITYTIWYNNTGDGNAKRVWVNDTLPANVDFVSASPVPTSSAGSTYSWYFANVVHDTTNYITVTVRVNATASDGEVLVNRADLAYQDQLKRPMTPSSSWANVTCVRPQITVEKIANVTQAYPGDSITYTIYYNNTGSINAGDVWINDTLPSGITVTSTNPTPTSTSGLTYTWHFSNVAPGTYSITITVTVNLTAPSGTITNWAYLDYTSANGWPLENTSDSADILIIVIPEFKTIAPVIMGMMTLTFIGFRRRKEMR